MWTDCSKPHASATPRSRSITTPCSVSFTISSQTDRAGRLNEFETAGSPCPLMAQSRHRLVEALNERAGSSGGLNHGRSRSGREAFTGFALKNLHGSLASLIMRSLKRVKHHRPPAFAANWIAWFCCLIHRSLPFTKNYVTVDGGCPETFWPLES
jgi:hypothetical protein